MGLTSSIQYGGEFDSLGGCAAKPAGTVVTNPDYAETMRTLARYGADAFYNGQIAENIAAAVQGDQAGVASDTALCLGDERFRITATYRDFDGTDGVGQAVSLSPVLPGIDSSGLIWFFSPGNMELLVKVLHAQNATCHEEVFAAIAAIADLLEEDFAVRSLFVVSHCICLAHC